MATQYATFSVGDLYFGVPVTDVQEVLRYQEMTPVPLAAAEVGGLINLRGQIVTAISLRRRLGLGDGPGEQRPMNVVLRTADGAVALLVDAIDDVVDVDEDAYEDPPETLAPSARELIIGTYKLEGRLLLVLDTDQAVAGTAAAA
jgi:purine-binding chemotaxis protein CheW